MFFSGVQSHLKTALLRCRKGFLLIAGVSFVINLLALTVPIYMMQVYDRVLTSHSVSTLSFLTVIAICVLFVLGLLDVIRSRILVRIGTWFDRILSPLAFSRGVDNAVRGSAYNAEAVRDIATIRNFLGGAGVVTLFDAPWLPIYLGFIYLLHPLLGHIALLGAIVLLMLALSTDLATRHIIFQANAANSRNLRGAESAMRNADVIDGMGMIGALARRWDRGNTEILELQARASDRAGSISAAARFFRLAIQICILCAGAYLVLDNKLTAGGMIAASIILSRALSPAEQAIGTWKYAVSARAAWNRLANLFQQPLLHGVSMPLPKPNGILSVENISFAPNSARRPIIAGISFELGVGEALAVIGPSAAGKSTLARLLVGSSRPDHGEIRLDGAEIFTWNRAQFGQFIGYLPQDVELFPGTVRENIARMDEDASPEDVVAAAICADVHETILALPNGYDTEIGEQGAKLSGGQRQRIGLARALYGRPVLLVLDEPNSSLDASGEDALRRALSSMKEAGTTVVVISHRPSLLAAMDKILVLSEGRQQLFGERTVVLGQIQRMTVAGSNRQHVRTIAS